MHLGILEQALPLDALGQALCTAGPRAGEAFPPLLKEKTLQRPCLKHRPVLAGAWMVGCLLLTAACATTSVNGEKAQGLTAGAFQKVVVLGFFNAEEDRRTFETLVAKALAAKGCDAVASLACLEHGVAHTEEAMEAQFRERGFDAVLILRVTDVQQVQTVIPETYYFPLEPYTYPWYAYWTDGLGLMIRGGYHERHDVVNLEGGLFSLETEKPVWFGHLETKRVQSIEALADSLGPALAKRLVREGLIP